MKSLALISLGFFALLGVGQSYANTIIPLQFPADMPLGNQPSDRNCVANTFIAGDSVTGTCRSTVAGTCAGRGCVPPYTNTVYIATWDKDGNVLSDTFCGKNVVHRPYPAVWTYQPGFNATTCYEPKQGSPTISVYDQFVGYDVWFEYVTTSPDGAYELLTQGLMGFLNQF